jgi:hemoglobin
MAFMVRRPHHENPDPTPAELHAHVAAARERKRAEAEAIGIDEDFIGQLVESFYTRIRDDALLGPIFAPRIADWPLHLDRMKGFWRSILHNSGEFSGNPMAKHLALPGLDESHFTHWLELFYATLRDLERHPAATRLVGTRARMIADSLLTGIATRETGIGAMRAGAGLPHV